MFTLQLYGGIKMTLKEIKQSQKKSSEELQDYLAFKRRGSQVKSKKGKGSYSRKQKHKDQIEKT